MKLEIPKLLERFGGDILSNLTRVINKKIDEIHTTTIGIIQSFDPETQTAIVQPAIKRVKTTETRNSIVYETANYPVLVNVPVVFAGGGEWFMTFPVKKGDECLIFSMERSIVKWKKYGGVQEPSHFKRKLSFKDAVVMVGIQSQNTSLPNFNSTEPQLRNREGDIAVTMTNEGVNLIGDVDNAVRFSKLEAKVNELTTKLNNHVHPGVIVEVTGGSGAPALGTTGSSGPSITDFTTDLSQAKVNEIKVP